MLEYPIRGLDPFGTAEFTDEFLRRLEASRRAASRRQEFALEFDHGPGGLLAGFDTRLMVRVDVDQGGIEANGAFEERDERSQPARVKLANRQRDRLAPVVM